MDIVYPDPDIIYKWYSTHYINIHQGRYYYTTRKVKNCALLSTHVFELNIIIMCIIRVLIVIEPINTK